MVLRNITDLRDIKLLPAVNKKVAQMTDDFCWGSFKKLFILGGPCLIRMKLDGVRIHPKKAEELLEKLQNLEEIQICLPDTLFEDLEEAGADVEKFRSFLENLMDIAVTNRWKVRYLLLRGWTIHFAEFLPKLINIFSKTLTKLWIFSSDDDVPYPEIEKALYFCQKLNHFSSENNPFYDVMPVLQSCSIRVLRISNAHFRSETDLAILMCGLKKSLEEICIFDHNTDKLLDLQIVTEEIVRLTDSGNDSKFTLKKINFNRNVFHCLVPQNAAIFFNLFANLTEFEARITKPLTFGLAFLKKHYCCSEEGVLSLKCRLAFQRRRAPNESIFNCLQRICDERAPNIINQLDFVGESSRGLNLRKSNAQVNIA